MPINYNQQTNSNLDYQGLLEQLGRDREFINNYQQVEPSNRYKRMLQQELAYQAKDNGIDYGKLDMLNPSEIKTDPSLTDNREVNQYLLNNIVNTYKKPDELGNALSNFAKVYYDNTKSTYDGLQKGRTFPIMYNSGYGDENLLGNVSGKGHQTTQETNQNIQITYNALRKVGYSDNQAKHLLEEIGRENGFQTSLLLGTHSDPANRATNMGLVSWQGERRTALINHLKKEGVMDSSGKWIANKQAIIESQARFMRQEMNKYKRTVKEFLNNPDVDRATSIRTLGEDYIAWRIKDPKYRALGLNSMGKWRNTIPRVLGS